MKNTTWISQELRERARILVVEDNPLNQKLDEFLLNNWGLRHEICSNGRQAVERLKVAGFDVVLMDIQMPELDGYEATRIIRSELGLGVPIIGITAHATQAEKTRCLLAGMNNYLTKPVDEHELLNLLYGYLVSEQLESAAGEQE
jgi:CheY-like chemotaxis protein